jgi:hypothetical protein
VKQKRERGEGRKKSPEDEHTSTTTVAHEASPADSRLCGDFCRSRYLMVEARVGLGRWVFDFQDHLFGVHSMKGSLAVVLLAEGLCLFIPLAIVGLVVRRISGRSLVEILRKKK